MDQNKTTILVAAHKSDPNLRQDGIYLPIHVGKALHPEVDLGFQGDNTGDNISEKNGSYCELTAIYWAWKNLEDYKYIGLAHYRRYLKIEESKYHSFLDDGGIVLPYPVHMRYDNYTNLSLLLTHEEAILAIDLLLRTLPDSRNAVRDYFWRSNKYSVFNMFLTNRKRFEEYCNFLFPYLQQLEGTVKKHNYFRLQRNIGYIAEALLGFWVEYKKIPVKYVSTEDFSTNAYDRSIRGKLRNLQRDLGFNLSYLPKHQKIFYYPAALNALRSQGYSIQDV